MQVLTAEQVIEHGLLSDEWAKHRLYNIDHTHSNKDRLALYHVEDLDQKSLDTSLSENQYFLFDGNL